MNIDVKIHNKILINWIKKSIKKLYTMSTDGDLSQIYMQG